MSVTRPVVKTETLKKINQTSLGISLPLESGQLERWYFHLGASNRISVIGSALVAQAAYLRRHLSLPYSPVVLASSIMSLTFLESMSGHSPTVSLRCASFQICISDCGRVERCMTQNDQQLVTCFHTQVVPHTELEHCSFAAAQKHSVINHLSDLDTLQVYVIWLPCHWQHPVSQCIRSGNVSITLLQTAHDVFAHTG